MYKESLSNRNVADIFLSPTHVFDRIRQKGNDILWRYLEHRYPHIFREDFYNIEEEHQKYQEIFLPYKEQYVVLRHYRNIGKSKGSILCLPPLGYSAAYFEYCFGQIVTLCRAGFDVFVINYPERPTNFEELSDDFLGMILNVLDTRRYSPIRIWCSVGIGNLFVERNAFLGHHIDVAFLINAPQYPKPFQQIAFAKKLHCPKSLPHSYLLFDDLDHFDPSMVRGEKAWKGIHYTLQLQWKEWVRNRTFASSVPSKKNAIRREKHADEVTYFVHPYQQNIAKVVHFYTEGHIGYSSKNPQAKQAIVLKEHQLPENFLEFFLDVLKRSLT